MFLESELQAVRRAYAKHVAFAAGVTDPRMEDALASVRREAFLGPGPWPLTEMLSGYRTTPTADPVYLYQDRVVGIAPQKFLNNGMPSFVTLLISLGDPQPGDHAVHVGAGVGYYTAVMSRLVEPAGRVTAIELEPDLAARARANLANWPHVAVVEGDGAAAIFDPADVILVNAGAVAPADAWLDRLKDGGRLVLPLTVGFTYQGRAMTRGAIFVIRRQGEAFHAAWKSPTAIYACAGQRDAGAEAALVAAFDRGGWERVTHLRRTGDVPDENCWVKGETWALTYA